CTTRLTRLCQPSDDDVLSVCAWISVADSHVAGQVPPLRLSPPALQMSDDPRIHRLRPRTEITPDSSDPAAELNEEQRAAATHGDGPLLIVAGAGTGKTRTLVVRVWHLLQQGVPPERILLLTFTRRAAQEMLARVERLAGPAGRRVRGGTFHATAHSLLRRFGAQAGLPSDFTILDQGDSEDLMGLSRT